MKDGIFYILLLIALVNVLWIIAKVWTRKRDKQDREYRKLEDIWRDHYAEERKRFVRDVKPADFDEPPTEKLP